VVHLGYAFRDANYSEPSNDEARENDKYNQVRLRGGIQGERWGLYAFVTNLLNEDDTTYLTCVHAQSVWKLPGIFEAQMHFCFRSNEETGRPAASRFLSGTTIQFMLILAFGLLCSASAYTTDITDTPVATVRIPDLHIIDPAINHALLMMHVPGIAVAVVTEQDLLLVQGYGLREFDVNDRVDANTLFPIASTSKAFTAFALATLVDEKKLQWDDPLTTHLPYLEFIDPYLTEHVTIRDALAHRIGLVRADPGWLANPDWSREQLLSRVRYIPSLDGFRQGWHYSNWMYTAAGEVIPALTGKSWDDYLDEVIFEPLDMQNTGTRFSMLQNATNVTAGHVLVDGKIITVPLRNIEVIGPAGSINSTATDMSKWCRLLLGKGSVGERTIVEEPTFAELLQPQVVINAPPEVATMGGGFQHLAYTFGWGRMDYQGKETMYWHNGGIDGIATQVTLFPESGICIAILANRSRADALNDAVRQTGLRVLMNNTRRHQHQSLEMKISHRYLRHRNMRH